MATRSLVVLVAILAGSTLPVDLVTHPDRLSPDHQFIVQQASRKAGENCSVTRHREQGGEKIVIRTQPFQKPFEVRRLSESDTDWFKLDGVVQNTWDSICFNRSSQRIVCGDENWRKDNTQAEIQFLEVPLK